MYPSDWTSGDDEWGPEPFTQAARDYQKRERDEADAYKYRQQKAEQQPRLGTYSSKSCGCGVGGLQWRKTSDEQWRLWDSTGRTHTCSYVQNPSKLKIFKNVCKST